MPTNSYARIATKDGIETAAHVRTRPILFSSEMVRAILENRKSQTRRIVKPQPVETVVNLLWCPASRKLFDGKRRMEDLRKDLSTCPYGLPGDRLWVREPHSLRDVQPNGYPQCLICYRADQQAMLASPGDGDSLEAADFDNPRQWRPSIFMPRWASRITLEITKVRVERLQDISADDAKTEGVDDAWLVAHHLSSDRVNGYCHLWDSIHGNCAWEKNPWVWVIEFQKV